MRNPRPHVLAACFTAAALISSTGNAQRSAAAAKPSDAQIEAQIKQTIAQEEALQGKDVLIQTTVKAGNVTLEGHVPNKAAKVLASTEVGQVRGVKNIMNNLDIGPAVAPAGAPAAAPAAASAAPAVAASADVYKQLTLPTPTKLPVRTVQEINTKTVKAGDTFLGTVASSVYANVPDNPATIPAIPSGTPVLIRVVEAKPAGRLVGYAELTLELAIIRLPAKPGAPGVDLSITTDKLSSKTNGRGVNTAEKTGAGAGIGAVIGALAGGGKGAAIGAASGGALGAGTNALMPGQQIDIKPETLLQFNVTSPITATVHLHNGIPQEMPASTQVELKTRPGM